MRRPLIGARIRERRRALGVTQSGLAARVGVSASYLNLIEANKRAIGGALLGRLAAELRLPIEALDGAAERRLHADLAELAGAPLLAELHLDPGDANELAGRHAPWAHALVQLHRTLQARERAVGALSDRLSQDPFLADAVHTVLTRAAAIRSSAEILQSVEDLSDAQRARFVSIIGDESERLAGVSQALAAYFDKAGADPRPATPVEEVDDFLREHRNHFPSLEDLAGALREQAPTQQAPGEALPGGEALPAASRRFARARLAAERFEDGRALSAIVEDSALLTSEPAKRRAFRVLASYVAGAMLFPYEAFHRAALEARYDIEALAQRFDASIEQVCHRLATLRRPGAEGIPWGLLRVDAAGFVSKRFPVPHLLLPRYGTGCPLWAVYAAFQTPGTLVRQLAEFPTGDRFLFVARTLEKPRPAFGLPRRLFSLMLACDANYADQTVYGDGLDLSSSAPAVPVGANCRLCARAACAWREEDPIIDA